MTTRPPTQGEPRAKRGARDRQRVVAISALGLSVVLVLASSLLVWRPSKAAPRLNIGTDPEGYVLEGLAEPGDTIELGESGPARIGGLAESGADLAGVVVHGGGRSAPATIDRSVEPPVWWVYAAPPEPGSTTFTVESLGTDGSSRTEEVEYEFVAPEPTDVVLSPELLQLGSSDSGANHQSEDTEGAEGPGLRSIDPGTGVATIVGAAPGVVHVGSILSAPPERDALPSGLLRRVTGLRGDENLLVAQTEPVALHEVVLQGSVIPSDDAGSGDGANGDGPEEVRPSSQDAETLGFAVSGSVGLGAGDTAELIDVLGPCGQCDHSEPIRASGEAPASRSEPTSSGSTPALADTDWKLEAGLRAEANLDMTLQIAWSWTWFAPLGSMSAHSNTIDLDATIAARVGVGSSGGDRSTDETATDESRADSAGPGETDTLFDVSGTDPGVWIDGPTSTAQAGGLSIALQTSLRLGLAWNGRLASDSELAVAAGFSSTGSADFGTDGEAVEGTTSSAGDLRWNAGSAGGIELRPIISASVALADGYGVVADLRAGIDVALPASSTGEPASLTVQAGSGIGPAPNGAWLPQPEMYTPLGNPDSFAEELADTSQDSEKSIGEWSETRERIAAPPPPRRAPVDPLSVMLLVDTSGSMSELDPNGVVKLDGAKSALRDFLSSVSDSARIGLRTYPDTAASGCNSGSVAFPIGEHDRTDIQSVISALEADGDTPTAVALEAAFVEDLPPTGKRTVVLISDGESTCGGDPCEVARSFADQGVEVETPTVNGIGFQISDTGAEELQCISDVTNGRYTTVDDVEALNEELRQLAGPVLAVQFDDIPSVSLDSAGTPSEPLIVTARVKNAGGKPANDVLVTLASDTDAVSIPDAGRQVGVVAAGEERTVRWVVVPATTGSVELEVHASLIGDITGESGASDTAEPSVESASDSDSQGSHLNGDSVVALLGDGWMSGMGAGSYQPDTDTPYDAERPNKCLRSTITIGSPVIDDDSGPFGDRVNLACASSTTADLLNASSSEKDPSRDGPLPSQVLQLENRDEVFDAVFISAGALDEQLAAWIRSCTAGRCDRGQTAGHRTPSDALVNSLTASYQAVNQAINSPSSLESRKGRTAPMIVPAYPLPFPLSTEAQQRCDLPVDVVRAVNQAIVSLNDDVRRATRLARGRGLPVHYVGETQAAFQGDTAWGEPSHTICDGAPQLHGLADTEAFYPTAEGYRSVTRRLSRAIETRGDEWFASPTTATDHSGASSSKSGTEWASIDAPVLTTDRAVWDLPGGDSVRAGSAVKVSARGYEPGSVVVAKLADGGPVLGSARSAPDGSVEIAANTPTWLEPGAAELDLIGADPEGRLLINQQDITIDAPRRWVWPVTAAASLLVAGVCLVLLVRRFQKRNSVPGPSATARPMPLSAT